MLIPEVHVTDDPVVVFAFVGFFAAAMVLALLFCLPRFSGATDLDDDQDQLRLE